MKMKGIAMQAGALVGAGILGVIGVFLAMAVAMWLELSPETAGLVAFLAFSAGAKTMRGIYQEGARLRRRADAKARRELREETRRRLEEASQRRRAAYG